MSKLLVTLFFSFLYLGVALAASNRTFPPDFRFGAATASYQVEGGWNDDGKGESNWDYICHTNPNFVDDLNNGDVACDSYHKWEEDVQMLKELGVDFYRFSLSWSRILPEGVENSTRNQKGIDYYNNLINGLLDNGIEPLLTLFHWDTPQVLEEQGGWLDEQIIDHYVYYARVCFEEFGDRVKSWLTFNEPRQTCLQGYGTGGNAPGILNSGIDDYKCAHNLIKAHAKAWHMYDEEFRAQQNGRVSITIDTSWNEPASDIPEDIEAAQRSIDFNYGWFADPILKGNYPQSMIDRIAARSAAQGYPESRLPAFTDEEVEYIKGTADFLGLNSYTTNMVKAAPDAPEPEVSFYSDLSTDAYSDPSWGESASSWLKVVPWGLGKLVRYLHERYQIEIIITESGFSDRGETLHDQERIDYYREYLSSLLDAILDDGVKVTGYTAWSLMDNFEWARGFTEKFGLYRVDFDDPERTRTPKDSAAYYVKVIKTRCLVDTCE